MINFYEPLKKEGISFEKLIRKTDRFALIQGKWRGKVVAFKILVDPERKYAKAALIKEAEILKILNKFPKVRAPKIFGFNKKAENPYFFEEFIEGSILERRSGFFFKDLQKDSIVEIAQILNNFIKIPLVNFRRIKNKSSFSSSYFQESLKLHQNIINSNLTSSQRTKLKNLIKLKPKKLFPVHGEVYPNNLVENKEGKIYLLDWENFGFGNLARDSVSVYLRLKDENQKQIFLKELKFKNQENFEEFFKIEIILQSIGSLRHLKGQKNYFLRQIKKVL